ncbi:hypothetical protein [Paenibacillus hamazuiensis]|nr:hypothetical protein [Paenibacillus hamazuiensis]
MRGFSYYFHHYGLSAALVLGAIVAVVLVYRNRERIWIRGSGRK